MYFQQYQKISVAENILFWQRLQKIVFNLSHNSEKYFEKALYQACKQICKILGVKRVAICIKDDLIADSEGLVSLPWRIKTNDLMVTSYSCLRLFAKMGYWTTILTRSQDLSAQMVIITKKNQKLSSNDKLLFHTVADTISLALEVSISEDKRRSLEKIANRVIYIKADNFQKKVELLQGRSFKCAYLIADAIDSVKQNVSQEKLQRYLKGILIKNGAIWGNAWGDMIHAVFSDFFYQTTSGDLLSAYRAAIEICQTIKQVTGLTMKVGLAYGLVKVDRYSIQMNQLNQSKIIEKAALAQEGRPGITTLQPPSQRLKHELKKLNFYFKRSQDLVRGSLTTVWKLIPQESYKLIYPRSEKTANDKILSKDLTLKLLLSKGVCGHAHLEGTVISTEIIKVLKKVKKFYHQHPQQADNFKKLTGKSYLQMMKFMDQICTWGENRKKLEFTKEFLPWLYLMKLGEASSPELIYELTQAQLQYDLKMQTGFSREIYPLVWIEMGLNYEECMDAYVRALEDILTKETLYGPVQLGVSIKRFHLVKRTNQNAYLKEIEYPYLKSLELISVFKQSRLAQKCQFFVDVVDIAKNNPFYATRKNSRRAQHTELFFNEVKHLGVKVFIHVLEELLDKEYVNHQKYYLKELPYILDLFEKLKIENARFIHLAYWPDDLPYLDRIKKADHEIAICQSSTRMLGAAHQPKSPFLLEKKAVINGLIFDQSFPRIIAGTDDGGPFCTRGIWQEYLTIYRDVEKWHGKLSADLAFIQLLRNSYNNLLPWEIEAKYQLNQEAIEWLMAYDLYDKKKELNNIMVQEAVQKRVTDIFKKKRLIK